MRELNGSELAGFIQERQVTTVRNLKQAWLVKPKLAIIATTDDAVSAKYTSLKKQYGQQIGVEVEIYQVKQQSVTELIDQIKKDDSIHGVILQLPLADPSATDLLCDLLPGNKDVDGLGKNADYDAATPTAINWLLAAYNVDLRDKKVVIVGQGKLVGKPLADIWAASGITSAVVDIDTEDADQIIASAEVLVTAVGKPEFIKTKDIAKDAVVVDAGVASEAGSLKGDVEASARQRDDLKITPLVGGVGPLTVAALFENVLTAARANKGQLPDEA